MSQKTWPSKPGARGDAFLTRATFHQQEATKSKQISHEEANGRRVVALGERDHLPPSWLVGWLLAQPGWVNIKHMSAATPAITRS